MNQIKFAIQYQTTIWGNETWSMKSKVSNRRLWKVLLADDMAVWNICCKIFLTKGMHSLDCLLLETQRHRDLTFTDSPSPQNPTTQHGLAQSQDPRTQSRSFMWMSGKNCLSCHLLSPKTYAIRKAEDGIQSGFKLEPRSQFRIRTFSAPS